ncbi:cytochrome P450 [Salix suchowensis]|nr:cytochrome P450 [Salix suchowensis]
MTEKGNEDKGMLVMTAGHDTSSFDPTRFENQASIPPYCFIPLEGGPRICPGYEFERIETLVTIHHLVTWKFLAGYPMPVPTKGLPIQTMPKTNFTF